jgi:glycosyltransferase involved in cell wall biosynthesis
LSANKHEVINSIPKDNKIVGHIGSIGFDHYINNFIIATEILKSDKIKFIFVGKQNAEIKKLANKINTQNIIFIDEVPHSELKDIYSFLDLGFILYKGVDENFEYCAPNKLYEYWAYGVPVIAHKLKGLQSEFNNEDTGALINLENSKEIAFYIKQYLEDNHREMIKKYYQLNYNMNDFLSRLLKKIKEL